MRFPPARRRLLFPTLAFALALALALVGLPGASAADARTAFFETRIRPVLVEHCYDCHSEKAGKRKGGLWLDRRAGWESGGDSGPALVPGAPEESLLIKAVRYHDPDLEMPPEEKLPPRLIADLESWVRDGAIDPRSDAGPPPAAAAPGIDIEKGRGFWSFQPLADPAPPAVADASWPRDPVDRFILARLEEAGLAPAPDAPRDVILRRLSIDLTGLPPTLAEQEAFLADTSPEAIEKVIDTLLASDAFGERWGRHWLDIVRYADSSGGGRALPFTDAWRFRDYVIRSFREDRPLDELIREHIAGDLLSRPGDDSNRADRLVGTGFLVLGPINYETQDKELLDLDIVDEQLDTIGRAFLGMTIGCARCHDHKFDPIPTRDYYAMAGIFTSTRYVEHANVSTWVTAPLPPTPAQAAALRRHEAESAAIQAEIAAVKRELAALGRGAGGDTRAVAPELLPGIVVDTPDAERVGAWQESAHSPRYVGDGYLHDLNEEKGAKSVTFRPAFPETGRYEVAVSYSAGDNRSARVPAVIRHRDGEETVRLNQKVAPDRDRLFQPVGTFYFSAGSDGYVRISSTGAEDGFVIADAVQFVPVDGAPPAKPARGKAPPSDRIGALENDLASIQARWKKHEAGKPRLSTVMCVADREEAADIAIRIRGGVRNFGEVVPRGFLQVATPPGSPAAPALEGSGRRELADWIASPRNPLTARVLANRIWLHLFGEGIVRSPDNFGTTGDAPTHPALLDHLARRLIDGGWTTKGLVRDLVLSRTYRMSSAATARGNAVDPENRLLWRMNRGRLDAETLRDSMLLIAGNLDPRAGGPCLPPDFKSEYGFEFTTRQRSVYVPVFRNELYEIFSTFDFANPNFVVGRRSQSTIPTQSLFLMNSPFIHEQSAAAARNILAQAPPGAGARERLRLVYRTILGRDATPQEERLSLEFLGAQGESPAPVSPDAWAGLTRSLFSCVDFQYIP